ncbi:TLC domain-containing protein [Dichotomocladium elegans]|nr:TLC domain-containing protein [Dichotomocladium elegans]
MQVLDTVFDALELPALKAHWHVVLLSTAAFQSIYLLSALISPVIFAKRFQFFSGYTPTNWHVHVVSSVHSILISLGSLYILFYDTELAANRVFGYSPFASDIYSVSCGYFIWDVMMAIRYVKYQGISMVFHGAAGFAVIFFAYRPFINYYGSIFLLYEASTPFLNFNWFMDKLGWTGSRTQLVNGIVLITVFFLARIVAGFTMSYRLWIELFSVKEMIPLSYWIIYGVANAVTSLLNVYWFGLMLRSLRKRFPKKPMTKAA